MLSAARFAHRRRPRRSGTPRHGRLPGRPARDASLPSAARRDVRGPATRARAPRPRATAPPRLTPRRSRPRSPRAISRSSSRPRRRGVIRPAAPDEARRRSNARASSASSRRPRGWLAAARARLADTRSSEGATRRRRGRADARGRAGRAGRATASSPGRLSGRRSISPAEQLGLLGVVLLGRDQALVAEVGQLGQPGRRVVRGEGGRRRARASAAAAGGRGRASEPRPAAGTGGPATAAGHRPGLLLLDRGPQGRGPHGRS